MKVDPKDRLSAKELLDHEIMKKRTFVKENVSTEPAYGSSTGIRKLIEKISVPRRRDFRNIKDFLPKHRFG